MQSLMQCTSIPSKPLISGCQINRRHSVQVACVSQQSAAQKPLVVVGSINADLVLKVDRLPAPGETLGAASLDFFPGGKGANQAAAAAKLGYPTVMVGQLGSDSNADALREALAAAGVRLQHVRYVEGPSGTAVILLQSSGENSIVIVGGANQAWPTALPDSTKQVIAGAGAVLLQREIPESVNIQVARAAATAGVPVLLDGGGVDAPLSSELLSQLSIISPNETELQRLTGQPADSEAQALAAANDLQQTALKLSQQQESQPPPEQQQEADSQGQLRVLVKRGSAGSMMVGADGQQEALQPAVTAPKVVDTTGAGDCFTAAFMVGLLEGRDTGAAMRFAAAAASICVSRPGAMTSLPTRQEVDQLVESL